MKFNSSYLLLLVLVIILFSTSNSAHQDSFIQCLNNQSYKSPFPISASIYTPNNSSFLTILDFYARDLMFMTPETPKPLFIVTAKDEPQVQATVTCAKTIGLLIKIRSGGHDFEGLSYVANVPFIVLDLFNLRSISIDLASQTMSVQSGAILGEIYYNIANKSKLLGFPAGVCPTVGAGGFFSGGGYGNMLRKYGLSIDNIVDARIVDVEGRILDREAMGEDLFWAIRGGGGASFGVILSWKLKLVNVPNKVTVFQVERTLEEGATNLVFKWQSVATMLPNELFIRLILDVVNGTREDVQKTIKATFLALYLGNIEKLLPVVNTSFPELGLKGSDCTEMSWIESTLYWTGLPIGSPIALLNRTQGQKYNVKLKSDFVYEPISKAGLETIWEKMIELEKLEMKWNPYGGRMSEISAWETPFPHRNALFKIQHLFVWPEPNDSNFYVDLARKFYDALTPYVSKNPREAFLNYRDIDLGGSKYSNATIEEAKVYGAKYFKSNFDRLVRVKTKVDPGNFFRNEQSIPPFPKK